MLARLSALLATLLISVTFLTPTASHAQAPPAEVSRTANCLTIMMGGDGLGGELTGPAWVEPAGPGWRLVIPLRGQPFANREVQSPPPAQDALSWFDLSSYPSEAQLPSDRDVMTERAMVMPSGTAWYIRAAGGYYWLGINAMVGRCFRLMNDARQVWPQG